jgi:hypothetical protein
MYTAQEGGFHHFAIITPDFQADRRLMEARYQPTSSLNTSVGAIYYDARTDVGCMFELLETNAALNFLFKSTYELSQTAVLADYAGSANIKRAADKGTDATPVGLTYPRIASLVVWAAKEGPFKCTPEAQALLKIFKIPSDCVIAP